MKRPILTKVCALFAVTGFFATGMSSTVQAREPLAAGVYHVRVRSVSEVSELLEDRDLDDAQTYANEEGVGFFVRLSADEATTLKADERVLAMTEELVASIGGTQTTGPSSYGLSWGLDRIDSPSGTDGAYNYPTDGWGVRVYVVDTGVRADHQEFEGRVVDGWSFKNDSEALNSYIAQNINCPSETRTLDASDKGTTDLHGHGTHVAGTIAGVLTGVAKKATIVPVRAMDRCGYGTVGTIDRALDWILADPNRTGPAVVNMSLGVESSSLIPALEHPSTGSITALLNAGVVLVAAAGNGGDDRIGDPADNSVPARTAGVISVAAMGQSDNETSYTNYGNFVDLFAPGDSIRSALMSSTSSYELSSGTSMASPHVAGTAALRRSCVTTSSRSDVVTWIIGNAVTGKITFQYPSATDNSPNKLLQVGMSSDTRPCAPTQVTTTPQYQGLQVSWVPQARNNSTVTGYSVTTTPASSGCTATGSTASTCTITGLIPWQTYSVTVTALTTGTNSTPSFAVSGAPTGRPNAPSITSVTPNLTSLDVVWSASGGATSYTATATPGGATCTASSTSCSLTGLSSATTYSVTVKATNQEGDSPASSAVSATTASLPSAPSGVAAATGLSSVTVSWSAVSGATGYSVLNSDGAVVCTTTQTNCVINNLVGGASYSFTVRASNSYGNSALAASVSATPDAQAGIVPSISAASGNRQVTLTWSVAEGNGLSYIVARDGNTIVCTTQATTCTVTGLTNGKSYTFGVIAINKSSQSSIAASVSARPGFTVKKTSVARRSQTSLTSLLRSVSNGRRTWSERGSCSISRGRLIAPRRKTSCTVTLRVAKTSKYPAMSTTVSISVL